MPLPRYSLFTLSKIKDLAASSKARSKTLLLPIVRLNDASRRSVGRRCTRRSRRNKSCACRAYHFAPQAQSGGGERNRTDDLLLAKQALSQLSYTPQSLGGPAAQRLAATAVALATARAAPRRIKHQATRSRPRRPQLLSGASFCTSRSRRQQELRL